MMRIVASHQVTLRGCRMRRERLIRLPARHDKTHQQRFRLVAQLPRQSKKPYPTDKSDKAQGNAIHMRRD